jgi:hypothetical protein
MTGLPSTRSNPVIALGYITPGSVAAIISAVSVIVVAVLGIKAAIIGSKRLDEIHVLVNSRLSEALNEIAHLKKVIGPTQDDTVKDDPPS